MCACDNLIKFHESKNSDLQFNLSIFPINGQQRLCIRQRN